MSKRNNRVYSPIFIIPILHLVHSPPPPPTTAPNICITIDFNFSWVLLQSFKGNVKTMVMQNIGRGRGGGRGGGWVIKGNYGQ